VRLRERYKLNLVAESFNLFNRDNQRLAIPSNGLISSASTLVQNSVTANIAPSRLLRITDQLHEAQRRLYPKANPASPEIHIHPLKSRCRPGFFWKLAFRLELALTTQIPEACHSDRRSPSRKGRASGVEEPAVALPAECGLKPSQNDPYSHISVPYCA
jgi:hypothetical protein